MKQIMIKTCGICKFFNRTYEGCNKLGVHNAEIRPYYGGCKYFQEVDRMVEVGDKFVITIGEKIINEKTGETLYKAEGFRTLVFDGIGLAKLTSYEPDEKNLLIYKKGLEEGKQIAMIELARAINEKYNKEA